MSGTKRIVAVAVGPQRYQPIGSEGVPKDVRRYIHGLVDGLKSAGHQIGGDYEIHYKERPQADLDDDKRSVIFLGEEEKPYDVIFAMSTNVVRAANTKANSTPIVGVVSDPKREGFSRSRNITGISARRSQTAGQCFEYFLATVPTLKRVRVLHKPGYGPSDRSLELVKKAAKRRGVGVDVVNIKSREDIETKLKAMKPRDIEDAAEAGILVLPVDICFAAARLIVDLAQKQRNLPVFFPITDVVRAGVDSALGGYGVPQYTCGRLMADYVGQILWDAASPGSLKMKDAEDEHFEWVVSGEAAAALNIKRPRVV